jgi:hypothetical protein
MVGSYDVQLPTLPSGKVDMTAANEIVAGPEQLRKFVALVGDAEELFFYGSVAYRGMMKNLLKRAQRDGLVGRHVRVVEARGGAGDIKGSLGKWAGEGVAAPRILEIPAEAVTPPPAAAAEAAARTRIREELAAVERKLEAKPPALERLDLIQKRLDLENEWEQSWEASGWPSKAVKPKAAEPWPVAPSETVADIARAFDEDAAAATAAATAKDPQGMYSRRLPKGRFGPTHEQVMVRTPFGDFQIEFIGATTGKTVRIVAAPATLKGAPAKTGAVKDR